MKGTLTKLDNQWMVRYDTFQNDHSYPLPAYNFLPLHPEYQTILPLDLDLEGNEVEFDWCVIVEHYTGKGIEYAKLINHSVESNEMIEDDGLTDDEWLIKELKKELSTCIACDEEKETHVICMDCIVKTNHEISDEEIYKASREHITDGGGAQGWIEAAFRQGAVWYREQLKCKI